MPSRSNYPTQFASDGLAVVEPFQFVVFFDLSIVSPSDYPTVREAGKRAILSLPLSEIDVLPKFLALGYNELPIEDEGLDEMIAEIEDEDMFDFCPAISNLARSHNQFIRFILCHPTAEGLFSTIKEAQIELQTRDAKIAKIGSLYWLRENQMAELVANLSRRVQGASLSNGRQS